MSLTTELPTSDDLVVAVGRLVAQVEELATSCVDASAWATAARRAVLGGLDRVESLVTSARARVLLAEREAGTWAGHGDRSFDEWWARTARSGDGAARSQVRQAETLEALPQVGAAFADGRLSATHVQAISRATDGRSPEAAARAATPEGQAQLVALGRRLEGREFSRAVDRWVAESAPARLERDHEAQRANRFLVLSDGPDGTRVKGLLDRAAGHRLRLALEAATPRPGLDDDRSREQRCADALAVLAEEVLSSTDTTPGAAVRPHVSFVLREETWAALLRARRGSGGVRGAGAVDPGCPSAPGGRTAAERLAASVADAPAITDEDGTPVPVSEALAVLCDCELTRVVLDAEGGPVDLGRTQRRYSGAMRRAIGARDGGCAWNGCAARVRWTQVHHIRWWERDAGPTSIANGVMLCSFHHHEVHRQDLAIARVPSGSARGRIGDGRPARYRFVAPDGRVVSAPVEVAGESPGPGAMTEVESRARGTTVAREVTAGASQLVVRGLADRPGRDSRDVVPRAG